MLSTLIRSLVRLPNRGEPGSVSHTIGAAAMHLLWPWSCPLCGVAAMADNKRRVCAACEQAIDAERLGSYCPGCGGDPRASQPGEGRCPACSSHPKAYTAVAVVGSYKGALQEAIVQWKFRRCPGLNPVIADLLSEVVAQQEWHERIEGLVPIPQPWARWFARQWFPVGELARGVGEGLEVPVWPVLAARHHRRQLGLRPDARRKNVRGVYRVRGNVDLRGRRLCVIDDVMTTGATLGEAAKMLRQAGAAEVFTAVVGKVGG